MKEKLISSTKLLEWIENDDQASGFWEGIRAIQAFDNLTDAIESGELDPDSPYEIKRGDYVELPDGSTRIIIDIQHEHDRYQVKGVSGWQHSISYLEKKELSAYAIGPDRFDVVVGFGAKKELTEWYKKETGVPDNEWVDYVIRKMPLDKPLSFEGDIMTLREFLDDVSKFPCIACYQDD